MDPAHPAALPAHFGDDAGAPFSVPGGYSIACRVLEQWVSQPLQSAAWEGPPVPDAVVSQAPGEFKYMLLEVCDESLSGLSGSLCPIKRQDCSRRWSGASGG